MMVEVSNITNAVEVFKFYRGPEMKSIGVLHTPVWGRLSTKGNRPKEVITPVPWAHYRNSIK
jgi:hypothetical protein